jgi:catalase
MRSWFRDCGGDTIDDPSMAWPDQRATVEIGVLEITAVVADSQAAERALMFLPAALPAGIEPASLLAVFVPDDGAQLTRFDK